MVVNYTLFALFLSCPGFDRERVQSYSKQELCRFAHLFCCAALSAGRIRNLISFANSSRKEGYVRVQLECDWLPLPVEECRTELVALILNL